MKLCTVPDCARAAVAHELCATHYKRTRRGQTLKQPVREYRTGDEAKEPISFRVTPDCMAKLVAAGESPSQAAAEILERWARRQT